jgi:hypothetical protein
MPVGPDSLCLPAFFRGVIVKGAANMKSRRHLRRASCASKGDPDEDRKLWRGITSAETPQAQGESA